VRQIAIATCASYPHADDDQPLLRSALLELGIEGVPLVWDDPANNFNDFELTVIRSTWDYTSKRGSFLDWARGIEHLENPASIVEWNTDKRYIDDLAEAGVPVVPTTYATTPDELEVPDAARFVVKPSIGAGSMGAKRFAADEVTAARQHVAQLANDNKVAMVQPYLDLVDDQHETGVVVIDGTVSHAISKGPMLGVTETDRSGLFLAEMIGSRTPTDEELEVVDHALRSVPGTSGPLLYARVDLLPTPTGPVVIELELTEPSLFLTTARPAASRLAAALAARLD